MKRHIIFNLVRNTVKLFTPKMKNVWEEEFDGQSAVFVCNHLRSKGPILMCTRFDLYKNMRPWIVSEMLKTRTTPKYIRGDFWWKPNKWYTKILDYTVPYPVALVLPPLLRGAEGIPVYHDARVLTTFRESIKCLKDNTNIVLFPEKPVAFGEYAQELSSGFAFIAKALYKTEGEIMKFYPVFIDDKNNKMRIGKAVKYNPDFVGKEQNAYIAKELKNKMNKLESEARIEFESKTKEKKK